jgi:hypothetical protein
MQYFNYHNHDICYFCVNECRKEKFNKSIEILIETKFKRSYIYAGSTGSTNQCGLSEKNYKLWKK